MKLEGKIALVTGANRGIGRATVESLLSAGVAKVYAGSRNLASLPDFNDDRVVPLLIDITDSTSVKAAVQQASDVDLLINNAGTAAMGDILDSPVEDIEADMDVNYFGTLRVVREFLPILEASDDAAIVNVVTLAAFVAFPSLGGYSASKSALFALSQAIRMSLAGRGIAVHTVNPGPIDTDMAKDIELEKTSPEDAADAIVRGLKADTGDIFPDPTSQQLFDVWKSDYLALEKAVHDMHFGEAA